MIDQNLTNLPTEACPASPDVIKNNNRLYDEQKYAGQYTWFYYNLGKYGYLCKICEVFYSDHPWPPGQGRGASESEKKIQPLRKLIHSFKSCHHEN